MRSCTSTTPTRTLPNTTSSRSSPLLADFCCSSTVDPASSASTRRRRFIKPRNSSQRQQCEHSDDDHDTNDTQGGDNRVEGKEAVLLLWQNIELPVALYQNRTCKSKSSTRFCKAEGRWSYPVVASRQKQGQAIITTVPTSRYPYLGNYPIRSDYRTCCAFKLKSQATLTGMLYARVLGYRVSALWKLHSKYPDTRRTIEFQRHLGSPFWPPSRTYPLLIILMR